MSAIAEIVDQKTGIHFEHVLMATDFSKASEGAMEYALAIVRHYGSALSILHVIAPEPREPIPMEPLPAELDRERQEAREQIKRLRQKAELQNAKCQFVLEQGPVLEVIAAVMEQDYTDLLVVGTHGRSGLNKVALGSVAEEMLHRAHCPVLAVGPNVKLAGTEKAEFRRILFATDFGPASAKALANALSLTEDYRAKLFLLYMMPPVPSTDLGPAAYGPPFFGAEAVTRWQRQTRDDSMRKLKQLISSTANLTERPEYIVEMDFLPEGILNVAAANRVDLIVMGASRTASPWVAAHTPWSLTHEVLCHANCPVLTACM